MLKTGEKMDRLPEQYTAETVGMYLDQVFGKVESVASILGTSWIERGDHIFIGGRSIRELLAEEFAHSHKRTEENFQADFDQFYRAQGKKLTHERVAEAMLTGKQVDFYVPDPNTGRIEKEPSKLVGNGFEPNPIKRPARMTRWQKFWSKLGFFQDKVAEQEDYTRRVGAQKRVQFYNKVGRAQMACIGSQSAEINAGWKEFYPERKDLDMLNLPARGPYRLSHQGMTGYVNCLLAVQKDKQENMLYTNEQLFDMQSPTMRQARADAAEELYRRSMVGMNGDVVWLCRLQHESRINLKARIDEQGRRLNFSGRDVVDQEDYREFSMLADTALELSQQAEQNKKQLNETYGENEYEKFRTELNELPDAIAMIRDSLGEQKRILSGELSLSPSDAGHRMARVMMGQAALSYFAKQLAGINASDFAGEQAMSESSNTGTHITIGDMGEGLSKVVQQVEALRDEYISDPKKISAQIENGVLNQRIRLKGFGKNAGAAASVSLEVLDARTAELQMNQEK